MGTGRISFWTAGEGSWRSIRRKEAWNTTPTTMPATSPAPRMRTETLLLTATTASGRYGRSGIRKDTASISTTTKKAVRKCTSTATGIRSIPITTWTAACSTAGAKTGTESTRWSAGTGTGRTEGSGKRQAEGSPTSIPIRKTAC